MFNYFPDNHAWSFTVLIALLAGGDISEVDDACRSLKELANSGDEAAQEAWHESWKRLGNRLEGLAVRDEEAGHYLSAGRKYLSASNYYTIAERQISHQNPKKMETYKQALKTFRKGIELGREPVEFVEVPYKETSLPALFIPALGDDPAPCMIHFDGGDVVKETYYLGERDVFRRRGVSQLIVDHPGVGEALRLRNLYSGPDTEVPAGACVDYLEGRPDVDPDRIGIMAPSLGGYYAPRAAAFEKRLKCCVAWGAAWDFGPVASRIASDKGQKDATGAFQLMFIFGKDTLEEAVEVAKKLTLEGVVDKITCPLLVTHGENDRLAPVWFAEKTIDGAVNSPKRELKIFKSDEGGVEHCQADNNELGVEYIADWVAETLGAFPKGTGV